MAGMTWSSVICIALCGSAVGQTTLYNLPGAGVGDGFGRGVRVAGDVDGDGRLDLLGASVGSNTGMGSSGYVHVVSGANGMVLRILPGGTNSGQYAAALASSDVNGDGRPDTLVGEPFAGAGRVHVFDAVDGSLLHLWTGAVAGDRFGAAIAELGDLDGDGIGDFAIGAPDADTAGASSGTVRVVSGFGGGTLYSLHGGAPGWRLGAALAAVPDLDGDGIQELLAGAPGSTAAGTTHTGWARVYSGATGALLATLAGAGSAGAFGSAVAPAGDVDGDGICDLLVGAPQPSPAGKGYARIHSGASFALLRHVDGAAPGERFGASVSGAGRVDGDARADFAVGAPLSATAGPSAGAVRVFSGATGALILELEGRASGEQLGAALQGGFDLDGDGRPDLAAGGPGSAMLRVVSTARLALSSDVHTLSQAAQGSQLLRLSAGPLHGGRPYLMLGTASGTSGFSFGGTHLALTPDRYLMHTRLHPGAAPLAGGIGLLDSQGEAAAVFGPLPALMHAAYAGSTFHHAFVVYDPAGGIFMASPPVPVTLVP